jgi:hypothetical protein
VEGAQAHEAQRAHDLAGKGHLLRLWTLPGHGRALGLWHARVDTTPLSPHPIDAAVTRPPAPMSARTPFVITEEAGSSGRGRAGH